MKYLTWKPEVVLHNLLLLFIRKISNILTKLLYCLSIFIKRLSATMLKKHKTGNYIIEVDEVLKIVNNLTFVWCGKVSSGCKMPCDATSQNRHYIYELINHDTSIISS